MRIISTTFFPGPNRHVLRPAMEALVDLDTYAGFASTANPSFVSRLLDALPGLKEHYCSRGHRGGFSERLNEGTYLGHVVEHVTLECLYLAGEKGVYGKTREVSENMVSVVFESETEGGGMEALTIAVEVVSTLWHKDLGNRLDTRLEQFRRRIAEYRLGPSTRAIVDAARRKNIPVARLDDQNLVRFGQGINQRRIMAAMTDATGIVGVEAAQDKVLAGRLLADAGLPTPRRRVAMSPDQAEQAFFELGRPVVVKPASGNHGRGVVMNIESPEEMKPAYLAAQAAQSGPVMVEQQISGTAYRLLVIGQEMVAATERQVPQVVGDGVHRVRDLVEDFNRDPRRGPGHGFPMSLVTWDAEMEQTLARQGWNRDSVLPKGVVCALRRTANMSTGATARDVTHEVGQDLARDAVRAAQAIGLDVAGVDVVTPRLNCGLLTAGGAIIEVNASPGLRMHLNPAIGSSRPVADHLVEYLFSGQNGRIPVAAVTGTNGKTTVTRMLGHIAGRAGYRVGMATTDGIAIGGELIKTGDLTGPWSARLVLNDPTVEMAVLETARGGMARGGLGFEDLDVAVVTNIGQDHLGQDGVETVDDLIHLKALIVDVIRPGGMAVLNADDPNVLTMRNRGRGGIVLFSTDPANDKVQQHLRAGGKAVYVKRGYLYYGWDGKERRLIGTRALPSSLGGVAAINVANAAAAAAAALALGFSPRKVADGLLTFPAGGAGLNRGRVEMLEGGDVRVLVDYGHNVSAITALGDICHRLRPRQIVTVIGLPGDRRNDDIQQSARVVAGFSHRIVVREDADLRGRRVGEVADLIRQAAMETTNREVTVVLDEAESVRHAILTADAGTLVLILYEQYGRVRQAAEQALAERDTVTRYRQEVLEQA